MLRESIWSQEEKEDGVRIDNPSVAVEYMCVCTHSVEEEGERDISVVEIDYSLQWSRGGGEEGWWLLEYDSGLDIADRRIQTSFILHCIYIS